MRKLFLQAFVLSSLLAACATREPEYIVQGVSTQRLSQHGAQAALVQNYLQKQLKSPLDRPIKALTIVLPPYPERLRRKQVEGKVAVRFTIDEEGKAVDPSIVGTSVPVLAAIAIDSVLKWRFEPLVRDNKPARIQLNYEFVFQLE
jgi:TonB family protein